MAKVRFWKDGKVYSIDSNKTPLLIWLNEDESDKLSKMPLEDCLMMVPKLKRSDEQIKNICNEMRSERKPKEIV